MEWKKVLLHKRREGGEGSGGSKKIVQSFPWNGRYSGGTN